ncbi:MAG: hypothetical protein ACR2Q3_02655 [Woeseiaceae bacterium]
MQDEQPATRRDGKNSAEETGRWVVIRDIGVLQVKLIVDGLRDLILVPVSLVMGVISLTRSGEDTGSEFYELLRLGKRSERWINLFGAAEKGRRQEEEPEPFPGEDIDAMVSRVENFVVDEYRRGGVTKQAKEHLDKAIDSLHKLASRDQPPPGH